MEAGCDTPQAQANSMCWPNLYLVLAAIMDLAVRQWCFICVDTVRGVVRSAHHDAFEGSDLSWSALVGVLHQNSAHMHLGGNPRGLLSQLDRFWEYFVEFIFVSLRGPTIMSNISTSTLSAQLNALTRPHHPSPGVYDAYFGWVEAFAREVTAVAKHEGRRGKATCSFFP
jgi:hypothetical protein